ncbi:MAG TPA: SWIM zinc finger family protein [Herpetosiphonaceae bacterium]
MSVPAILPQPSTDTLTIDYYLDGDTLIIASATIPGRLYVTTSKDCSCPAGLHELPCKHAELRLSLLRPRTDAALVLTLDQADALF